MNRKIKVYHGTTKENYLKILAEGFNRGEEVWNCSDLLATYFYNFNKVKEGEELDDEETEKRCISDAICNAQATAAVQNSDSNNLYVFEIEINEDLIKDDESCPDMDYASCCSNDDLNEFGKITRVFKSEAYNKGLRVFFIGHNDLLTDIELTEIEEEALEKLRDNEIYLDGMLDLCNDWEEVTNWTTQRSFERAIKTVTERRKKRE